MNHWTISNFVSNPVGFYARCWNLKVLPVYTATSIVAALFMYLGLFNLVPSLCIAALLVLSLNATRKLWAPKQFGGQIGELAHGISDYFSTNRDYWLIEELCWSLCALLSLGFGVSLCHENRLRQKDVDTLKRIPKDILVQFCNINRWYGLFSWLGGKIKDFFLTNPYTYLKSCRENGLMPIGLIFVAMTAFTYFIPMLIPFVPQYTLFVCVTHAAVASCANAHSNAVNKKKNHKDIHDHQIGSVTLPRQLAGIHLPRLLFTVGGANLDKPPRQSHYGVPSDGIDICMSRLLLGDDKHPSGGSYGHYG